MTKWAWRVVQAAIIGVPLYWLATDAKALQDGQLLIGVPLLAVLVAYTVTGAGTALADWVRFRLLPCLFGKVGKPQSDPLSPRGPDRLAGELPQQGFRPRIGKDAR